MESAIMRSARIGAACIAASITAALFIAPRAVAAQTAVLRPDQIAGTIWAEPELGKFVMGSRATVYIWPRDSTIKAAIRAACAAAVASPSAWLVARTEFAERTGVSYGDTVTRDIGILQTLVSQPHAVAQADTTGRFLFDSVPPGYYLVEAETMMNGSIVQWWGGVSTVPLPPPLRLLASQEVKLGPLEFRHIQFCTDPEPRTGVNAFVDDKPPVIAGRVYKSGEVDAGPSVAYSGVQPKYPESLLKSGLTGEAVLEFVITPSGEADMSSVRVARETQPGFADSARESLRTMRFNPGTLRGQPVAMTVSQTFTFSIAASAAGPPLRLPLP